MEATEPIANENREIIITVVDLGRIEISLGELEILGYLYFLFNTEYYGRVVDCFFSNQSRYNSY